MKTVTIAVMLLIGFSLEAQQIQMEVGGSLVIGNSQEANPSPGTIRWTGSDFEAYNGLTWVTMTGGHTAPATDPDGNIYQTLRIGDQIWFLENLRTTKYSDGSNIQFVTDNNQWAGLTSGAYCWFENNNIYEIPHGKLYNWFAVDDGRGLCPDGFRVPSTADFTELVEFLGGHFVAGGKLKQDGFSTWISPNTDATNSSKFNAVSTGDRHPSGVHQSGFFGYYTNLWASDEASSTEGASLFLGTGTASAPLSSRDKKYGEPVRCVK